MRVGPTVLYSSCGWGTCLEGRKEYSTPLLLIALLVLERSENSFSVEVVVVFVFVLVSEREDWNPDKRW